MRAMLASGHGSGAARRTAGPRGRAYGGRVPDSPPDGWIRRITRACLRHRGVTGRRPAGVGVRRQPGGRRPAADPGGRRRRGAGLHRGARPGRGGDPRARARPLRRVVPAPLPRGPTRPRPSSTTCAGRSSPRCSASTASGRTRCAPGRSSPGRSPTCSCVQAAAVDGPAGARRGRARDRLGRGDALALAAAHARGARPAARPRAGSRCGRGRRCSPPPGRRSSAPPTSRSRWRRPSPAFGSSRGSARRRARSPRSSGGAARLFAERMRAARLTARLNPTLLALPTLGQVGVIGVRRHASPCNGSITLGTFLAFSTYVAQLVGPARLLGSLVVSAQLARAGVERVYDLVDSQPDVVDPTSPEALPDGPLSVELDDVTFGYSRREPVLDGVSLRVEPGETLALVGHGRVRASRPSRCCCRGSTTRRPASCASVACRCRRCGSPTCAASSGVVFEEAFLFSDTIRANIAYGRPDATDDEVLAAARAAQVHRSSSRCPRATTRSSASGGSRCPAGSGSGSRWPAPCSPTRASSCSTTPPPRSTRPPRRPSTRRCAA